MGDDDDCNDELLLLFTRVTSTAHAISFSSSSRLHRIMLTVRFFNAAVGKMAARLFG